MDYLRGVIVDDHSTAQEVYLARNVRVATDRERKVYGVRVAKHGFRLR